MVDELKPVISRPGVLRIPATAPETAPGSGVFLLDGGVETFTGSGVYSFPLGPAFDVATTASPPSARLTFAAEDLPTTTHTIVVTRTYDGITETLREGWNTFAAGGAILEDLEIPVGVPVTYQAQGFDEFGFDLGKTDQVTVQIDVDPSLVWISDPTNRNLVLQVEAPVDFAEDLEEAREVQVYQAGNRTVALLGSLGKLQNIPLRVRTKTVADGVLLREVLRQTNVLIRTAPPVDLPRRLYVVVPVVKKTRTGTINDIQYGGGWADWEMTGQEVSPTTLDILIPAVTWQQVLEAFDGATWQQVIDFYADMSWFDVIQEFASGGD